MQEARRNRDRTEATRQALLAAARALFVEQGYAATSTPEIAAAAGVTRGALYHHFVDKRDLFRGVLQLEVEAVVDRIESAAPSSSAPQTALLAGSDAYLDAMSLPGRTRLLLVDGPAVLGIEEMDALDRAHAAKSLHQGLVDALPEAAVPPRLASLLAAAFDRAALEIDAGADRAQVAATMRWLLERVLAPG